MIKVDRFRVPRPAVLSLENNSPAQRELANAEEFYEQKKLLRRQERFQFKVFQHKEVRGALTELFHGKCAYCESKVVNVAPVDVELFRPKSGVVENPKHPGYWWLAMVWENMLASCINCNRISIHDGVKTGKANRFPLKNESQRAFHPGQEKDEVPLLLDPCVDNPEEHLVFEETGIVVSDTQLGQTTISVLGLNRPHLVQSRMETTQLVLRQLMVLKQQISKEFQNADEVKRQLELLKQMTDSKEEFAALKRQFIREWMDKNINHLSFLDGKSLEVINPNTPHISKARKQHAKASFTAFEHEQSSYTLDDKQGREKYRRQRRLIEGIEIKNIKAIKTLKLDLTSDSGRTPWLMLLGENGTGKSTVLQATALTLLGAKSFVRLAKVNNLNPSDFLRFRCKQGSISVKLSGFSGPHKLVFRADRVDFTGPTGDKTSIDFRGSNWNVHGEGWDPQMLLIGYGATKLLPRKDNQPNLPQDNDYSRVDNLFNPFVPLLNAEKWLLSINRTHFDNIALILKDLMSLTPTAKLIRNGGHILVVEHSARVPLCQLSDGYQSMVAMTVDILEVALRLWPNLQEAEGVVLLDEVGAHLHPTWKMRVVGALRKALPAMQFLATTHDPLCLRGIGSREVAVMQRGEDSQVIALTELPSPADFRVDQLLTSDFFGLNSTVDPDVEAIFDEYYALLALTTLTQIQDQRLNELRIELKERRYLGTTLRESLMYEAIDQLVSDRRREPTIPFADLKQSAVNEVAQIWNETISDNYDFEP
jgi:uncharacterized protein (TIGR02646 family)